jgi:hypothetical protein
MQRMKVDLPHPDGPMMAVIARWGMVIVIGLSTWCGPNPASRQSTSIRGEAGAAAPAGAGR